MIKRPGTTGALDQPFEAPDVGHSSQIHRWSCAGLRTCCDSRTILTYQVASSVFRDVGPRRRSNDSACARASERLPRDPPPDTPSGIRWSQHAGGDGRVGVLARRTAALRIRRRSTRGSGCDRTEPGCHCRSRRHVDIGGCAGRPDRCWRIGRCRPPSLRVAEQARLKDTINIGQFIAGAGRFAARQANAAS